MRKKILRFLFICLLIGLGWSIGYLRIPHLGYPNDFWRGLLMGLAFVLLIISIRKLSKTEKKPNKPSQGRWRNLFILVILASLGIHLLIDTRKENGLEELSNLQQAIIDHKNNEIDSLRSQQYGAIMQDLLSEVREQVKSDSGRVSEPLINRIVNFSKSLPTFFAKGDSSLQGRKVSPERGQLLLQLCHLNMDSGSFEAIKRNVDFSFANLQDCELNNINLDHCRLTSSNFLGARLVGCSFVGTELAESNFVHAKLLNSDFSESNLTNSNLSWAQIKDCSFENAVADGFSCTQTNLINGNFRNTSMKWSDWTGTIISRSFFVSSDLLQSDMLSSTFESSDFRDARLRKAVLTSAKFNATKLDSIEVGDDWFGQLETEKVKGRKEIIDGYILEERETSTESSKKFILLKK